MGRGRDNGPVDQSTKKPKVRKNKERGDNWVLFKPNSIEENTELPILVSEELLAEMKKMSSQELMNILLPDNANNVSLTSEKKNCQLTDAIQILPPELREKIYKEFIKNQLRQREALGWEKVNKSILTAPFCEYQQRIVRLFFYSRGRGLWRDCCVTCYRKNKERHLLDNYDEEEYDECFQKIISEETEPPKNSYIYEKYFKKFEEDQTGMAEKIKEFSPELGEKVYKEFVKNKLKKRELQGWGRIGDMIKGFPYCKYHEQLTVPILRLGYVHAFSESSYCLVCLRKGRKHHLPYSLSWNYLIQQS